VGKAGHPLVQDDRLRLIPPAVRRLEDYIALTDCRMKSDRKDVIPIVDGNRFINPPTRRPQDQGIQIDHSCSPCPDEWMCLGKRSLVILLSRQGGETARHPDDGASLIYIPRRAEMVGADRRLDESEILHPPPAASTETHRLLRRCCLRQPNLDR
jgi:hypothetical protein